MNRVKDYTHFAICYCGLGYLVLWPLSSLDTDGQLFGASLICGKETFALLERLCEARHPLQLSAPLHVLGAASSLFVMGRFSLHAIGRARRNSAVAASDASLLAAHLPVRLARLREPKRVRRPRPVKPRAQFGLRGTPH